MTISFAEENVNEYKFNFPKDECIYSLSIERNGSWEKTIELLTDKLTFPNERGKYCLWLKSEDFIKPSRIHRMKSIWNDTKLAWLAKSQCSLFSHKNGEKDFYSAIAELNMEQLKAGLNYSRINTNSFMFILDSKDKDVSDIDIFLSSQYSDFEKVVRFFFEKNIIFVRTTGRFDDKELSIDFFGKKEMLLNYFSKANLPSSCKQACKKDTKQ